MKLKQLLPIISKEQKITIRYNCEDVFEGYTDDYYIKEHEDKYVIDLWHSKLYGSLLILLSDTPNL